MHLGLVLETNEPERAWNAFRLATAALDEGHTVETFLFGDGVEAPDIEADDINPRGVLRNYVQNGGTVVACEECLDARDLEGDELRPRGDLADCLQILEDADEVLTFG